MRKIILPILVFSSIFTTFTPMASFAEFTDSDYENFYQVFDKGPTIPGNSSDSLKWVTQGLTYSSKYNMLLTSHYWKNGKDASDKKPSTIAKVGVDGDFKGNVSLKNPDGTDHYGHVGGIAIANDDLWIASTDSGSKLYRVDLEKIINGGDGEDVTLDKEYDVPASSTITAENGGLWIASYVMNESCVSHEDKEFGSVYRYSIDANGDPQYNKKYPIPDEVQGLAITDGYFYFSRSCGRENESYLSIYGRTSDLGPDIDNSRNSMKTLPMSQGIVEVGSRMYLNFESWSPIYRLGEDGNGKGAYPTKFLHHADTSGLPSVKKEKFSSSKSNPMDSISRWFNDLF